ncbi:SURF1 family protein [Caulobacter sp. SLTY]|uniref:SURF1 family protein n=1 Tax=Caulobacter sp. SLTY TaxID=2683262 RepID=UPI0014130BDA|nr:SURF1 family cytochrome oxidase biogenesis protein [Caulobacter sp. SLTY]NBB15960.1 SURF1 family protein [Caulobacter sp. SLTY]
MSARRFPIILTVASAIALAILLWLGTWQMQRLAWKTDILTRIEAARTAAPVSIDDILRLKTAGQQVEWRKVRLECRPDTAPDASNALIYGLVNGEVAWRVITPCPLVGRTDTLAVERGYFHALDGVVDPKAVPTLPPPRAVVGIVRLTAPTASALAVVVPAKIPGGLRANARDASLISAVAGSNGIDDLYISVESEIPAARDLTPAPTPPSITNRHLEYALTWYGLAATLVAIYAAMLWRRFKSTKAL